MELGEHKTTKRELLDPDNPTPEMMYHCKTYYKKILNPIVDWTTDEVWEFIKEYEVRYCCLYDEGFERLGCIGCPMAGRENRERDFARYPKYKENYIRAFDKMLKKHPSKRGWKNGEEVFEWWMYAEKGYPNHDQERVKEQEHE